MNLISRLIPALAFSMLMPAITRADGINSIIVWTTDGSNVRYLLEEHPKILMTSTDLVLKTISTEVFYPLSDYVKFTFGTKDINGTQIEHLLTENKAIIKITSQTVSINNLLPNESVSVYTVDGKMVDYINANADGQTSFSIADYTNGIYVIKTHDKSFKFVKK